MQEPPVLGGQDLETRMIESSKVDEEFVYIDTGQLKDGLIKEMSNQFENANSKSTHQFSQIQGKIEASKNDILSRLDLFVKSLDEWEKKNASKDQSREEFEK